MTDQPKPEVIAVLGEKVPLQFSADEHFDGEVSVRFSAYTLDGDIDDPDSALVQAGTWHTSLPSKAVHDANSPTKRTIVEWTVEFDGYPHLRKKLCFIRCTASGKSASGRGIRARGLNTLRVPGIALTDKKELLDIFLHDFHRKDDSGKRVVDTDKIYQCVDALTWQQRKLLATYDISSGIGNGRLVVFITLTGVTERLMYAGTLVWAKNSVHANATFTVFSCRGKGKLVTLLAHTNHFCVYTGNPKTAAFFRGDQNGAKPMDWLSPNCKTPPSFRLGSQCSSVTSGVIYSRLFTNEGEDVMLGNFIHGMVNTTGCWLLYRNFNWPDRRRNAMFRVYTDYRDGENEVQARNSLKTLEYGVGPAEAAALDEVDSLNKFLYCDRNYASNFFFRHVVGIQFFAAEHKYYGDFANLYETHGMELKASFPKSELLRDPGPGPNTKPLYYDVRIRAKKDPAYVPPDSLWETNVEGYKTAVGFIPRAKWRIRLQPEDVQNYTWADCYFYKPEKRSLDDALAIPVQAVP